MFIPRNMQINKCQYIGKLQSFLMLEKWCTQIESSQHLKG